MKKYRTFYAMKLELKKLASSIREFGNRSDRYHYRHLHIARCLLKGRTMEQIEPVVRDLRQRDEKLIASLMEKWKLALAAEAAQDAAIVPVMAEAV